MARIDKVLTNMVDSLMSEKETYCYNQIMSVFNDKHIITKDYNILPPKMLVYVYNMNVKVKVTNIFLLNGDIMVSFQVNDMIFNENINALSNESKNIILNYIIKLCRTLKQKNTLAMIRTESSTLEIPLRKTAFGKIVTIEEFRDRVENSPLCNFIDYYMPKEIISKDKFYEMNDFDFNIAINEYIFKETIK